jgi:hypothetical protein
MPGGREAWCPRCDEVRAARAGAACPVCGRDLLAVPPARPGQPPARPAQRVGRRLRGLVSAAGAVAAALLVTAAVAGGFAAGWLTRTTPSAPAAAPATTVPEFVDQGPVTGRRQFNWQDTDGAVRVRLRSASVGVGFTRLELHVDGVPRSRQVSALAGLRVRDAAGNDLLPGGEVASINTAGSRPSPGGGVDTEVVLDRALDQQAVATVELDGLTVGAHVEEHLLGSLVDRELQELLEQADPAQVDRLAERRSCPACRLRVVCEDCRTVRPAGTAYRGGLIVVLLEAVGPPQRSAINPSRRQVVVTGDAGLPELGAWIQGEGDLAAVTVRADELAASAMRGAPGPDRMHFQVEVSALAEQALRGRWVIGQPGGSG